VEVSSIPKKNMFEIFSQGLFEGVKPMMVVRDHLVRHPDRCTQQAVCVPICPTGAWLSTPPYKFDASRCLESCRLCLDACPSQAIYAVYRKGDKLLEPKQKG
jgi:Fe-S-cluster-containing hydrogenase component 2